MLPPVEPDNNNNDEATTPASTVVGLRLAALPMDQCAARMLNLARLSAPPPPPPTPTTTTPIIMSERLSAPSRLLLLEGHDAASLLVRLCAPAVCAALHGVGLAWAPALVLLCLWRGSAAPPALLTLMGTALALTHEADAPLCAAWTVVGAALVVMAGHLGGWGAQAAGAVAGVLWLVTASPPPTQGAAPLLVALRATLYEAACLFAHPQQPAECWARYGALLACATPLTLAGALAVLGAALLWTRRVTAPQAEAAEAPVDALDVQEAFRRARAQYYLNGAPPLTEKNA